MNAIPIYEEIINEIGNQTLSRFGLNIFNLNTYAAYEASAEGTNNTFETYSKHKNNPQYFGHTFEELDVTKRNIDAALHKEDVYYSTTDNLGEVNHPITDVRKISNEGEILENYQHKVIKNTADLFGKDNKYLQNDKIVVAQDDYEKHKKYLENMIANSKDPETKKNAEILLSKLEASEITRKEAENARTTAIKIQTQQAGNHIIQTGLSDAIIVALSTLANGAIWEIKDSFKNPEVSIKIRIKRLLQKVVEEFYKNFKRGATFGALDIGINILSQIFQSIFSKIKALWTSLRTSGKFIYNAIYSYINGEIKDYKTLLSRIIKGILSAIIMTGSIALETKLEAFLAPILTPSVAAYVAPALSIIIGAIAVVITMRSVDVALNVLFTAFAQAKKAKLNAEKVRKICEEMLPQLIEQRKELEELIEKTFKKRKLLFEKSFDDLRKGINNNEIELVINGLIQINEMYGKKLQFVTFKEFDDFMKSDEKLIL